MSEKEVSEMQRRIDEGIRLAQMRLWERAGRTRQTLVVSRGGKIQELIPEGFAESMASSEGDPLARRNNR